MFVGRGIYMVEADQRRFDTRLDGFCDNGPARLPQTCAGLRVLLPIVLLFEQIALDFALL